MKKKFLILLTLVFAVAVTLSFSTDNTSYHADEVLPWSINESNNSI